MFRYILKTCLLSLLLMPVPLLANGGNGCLNPWSKNCQQPNPCKYASQRNCNQQGHGQSVPDGGSTSAYLLAVGVTCLAAMVARARMSKSHAS
jgi:hypothetical protein